MIQTNFSEGQMPMELYDTQLNDDVSAYQFQCVAQDMVAAFQAKQRELLHAITEQPQITLNRFTKKYGIQMDAKEDLEKIIAMMLSSQKPA